MAKSVLEEIAKIKDFVEACKKIEDFMGFNVGLSKHPGKSYILAKRYSSPKPLCVLAVQLDYFDPIQHSIIDGAIYESMYGRSMTPEESEASLISRHDEVFDAIKYKNENRMLTH